VIYDLACDLWLNVAPSRGKPPTQALLILKITGISIADSGVHPARGLSSLYLFYTYPAKTLFLALQGDCGDFLYFVTLCGVDENVVRATKS